MPPTRRALLFLLPLAALALASSSARAQTAAAPAAAPPTPALRSLTPAELDALRPLAQRGVALLVRDPSAGPRAVITAVVRARAPLDTVRTVIATPEQYPAFMHGITSMEVTSRHENHIGFRFHVAAAIFDVSTTAALHVVNAHRIDGQILQSQLGPGGLRWDLYPDGDGTLIAYSTWGDPTQANWFLRAVARASQDAIAAMQLSYDVMLVLAAARRAEIVAGRRVPPRPSARYAATGPLAPPAAGPWLALARSAVVGAIALDDDGVITQSTVATWVPSAPAQVSARLADVASYPQHWHAMRELRVLSEPAPGVQRFRSVVDTPVFRTEGEQDRVLESGADGPVVWWRGVSGDYANDAQRWDVRAEAAGGSVVLLTGGAEYNRTGFVARNVLSTDVWMLPGYAAAWKMVWMRMGLGGL